MSTVFVCLWRLSDQYCTPFLGHVSDVRSQARRKFERLIKIFPDLELDDGNKVDSAGNNVKDLLYRCSFLCEDQNWECNNNNRAEQQARNARYYKNECIVRSSHFRHSKSSQSSESIFTPICTPSIYARLSSFNLICEALARCPLELIAIATDR